MDKLMRLFLSLLIIFCFFSCESVEHEKKIFTEEERLEYAKLLIPSRSRHEQGGSGEAMLLRESNSLDSTNASVYRYMSIAFIKRGFGAEFYPLYAKAVELDPLTWLGWRGYMFLYYYRDYNRAIKDFDALDPLTPNFVDYPQAQSIDFMRGIAYLGLDDYDTAIEYLDKYIEYESESIGIEYIDDKAMLYKAIALFKQEKISEALKVIDLANSYSFKSSEYYFWKAKCLTKQNQKEEARDHLNIAETKLAQGNHFDRNYVDEFYQLHQAYIDDLREELAQD